MATKLTTALNLTVTVISTSAHKEGDAKEGLGAAAFLNSSDGEAMGKAAESLDGIIDTARAERRRGPLPSSEPAGGPRAVPRRPAGAVPQRPPLSAAQPSSCVCAAAGPLAGVRPARPLSVPQPAQAAEEARAGALGGAWAASSC